MKRYYGFHALTQGCWWSFLSYLSTGLGILFIPRTVEQAVVSVGISGGIIYLSHKVGKHKNWI